MATEILILVGIIVVVTLIIFKFSSFNQNITFKIGLIFLIFFILSIGFLVIKHDISLSSSEGITKALKIYALWMGNILGNIVKISGYALNQNWGTNLTSGR